MGINSIFGGIGVFLVLFIIFLTVAIVVVTAIANWKIFKKAGKEGWEAIIPFYSNYVLVDISGLNWWWFLILLAPSIASLVSEDLAGIATLAGALASFNCYYNLAKKFRKSTSYAVLAGIFSFIFMFIFAFSKSETYYAEEQVSSNGVFPGSTNTTTNNGNTNTSVNQQTQLKFCSKCGCKMGNDDQFCAICGQEYKSK